MPSLALLSPKPLAGKTTIACGLARSIAAKGKSVALRRLGDDPHAVQDGAVFARLGAANSAEVQLLEAPAAESATLDGIDPEARVIVVADGGTPAEELAEYCRPLGPRMHGVLLNRLPAKRRDEVRAATGRAGLRLLAAIPEDRLLASPSFGEIREALKAETTFFDSKGDQALDRLLIASIAADPGQGYFERHAANTVIVRSDKPDLQLAALNAGAGCLILTGGLPVLHYVLERAQEDEIPIMRTNLATVDAVKTIEGLFGSGPFSASEAKLRRLEQLLSEAEMEALLAV